MRRIHMDRLSQVYRNAFWAYNHNSACRNVVVEALYGFRSTTVLRNGPRILRACETMHRELDAEAQHEPR